MAFGFTSYIVENDEKLALAMERAARTTDDLRVPLRSIAKDFRKSRQAIFNLKGPGQYPDLKETTKKSKERAVGFVYPILKLTGRLDASVTNSGDKENVTRIRKLSMDLGTKTPYAIYHQNGTSKMPLRKFLFVGPESSRFANSQISGFPERALNTLNSFVLRKLGNSMEQATGIKPKIRGDK